MSRFLATPMLSSLPYADVWASADMPSLCMRRCCPEPQAQSRHMPANGKKRRAPSMPHTTKPSSTNCRPAQHATARCANVPAAP